MTKATRGIPSALRTPLLSGSLELVLPVLFGQSSVQTRFEKSVDWGDNEPLRRYSIVDRSSSSLSPCLVRLAALLSVHLAAS